MMKSFNKTEADIFPYASFTAWGHPFFSGYSLTTTFELKEAKPVYWYLVTLTFTTLTISIFLSKTDFDENVELNNLLDVNLVT